MAYQYYVQNKKKQSQKFLHSDLLDDQICIHQTIYLTCQLFDITYAGILTLKREESGYKIYCKYITLLLLEDIQREFDIIFYPFHMISFYGTILVELVAKS